MTGPDNPPLACPDHSLTREEVVDVFLKWAASAEAQLDDEAPVVGVMRASMQEWPCEQ